MINISSFIFDISRVVLETRWSRVEQVRGEISASRIDRKSSCPRASCPRRIRRRRVVPGRDSLESERKPRQGRTTLSSFT